MYNILIPNGDVFRRDLFETDPCPGKLKQVVFTNGVKGSIIPARMSAIIYQDGVIVLRDPEEGERLLKKLHSELKLERGSFSEEYPEQRMVATFLTPERCVLELGANIGRNTLIISSILKETRVSSVSPTRGSRVVTMECNKETCLALALNRSLNKKEFIIEPRALSKRPLKLEGWNSTPCNASEGNVDIIDFFQLEDKYKIHFDTMVVDAEGALYWILLDEPKLLRNIDLLIVENDYRNDMHRSVVDRILLENGFKILYREALDARPRFYETWAR